MDPSSSSTMLNGKRKNFPGNRSDAGWEYGAEVDGNPRKVKCNFCQGIISGNIYRLKHHLACSRRNVRSCPNVPVDVKIKMRKILEDASHDNVLCCSKEQDDIKIEMRKVLEDAIGGESNKDVQRKKELKKELIGELILTAKEEIEGRIEFIGCMVDLRKELDGGRIDGKR